MRRELKLPQFFMCPFFGQDLQLDPKLTQGDFCAIYFNLIDKITFCLLIAYITPIILLLTSKMGTHKIL